MFPNAPPQFGVMYPPVESRVFPLPTALDAKWDITRDELKKYYDMFLSVADANGNIPNDKAKSILEQTKLPNKDLFVIWEMANRGSKPFFTPSEMIVAMHLAKGRLRNMPVGPNIPHELESFLSVSLEEAFYMAGLPAPLIGNLAPGFASGLFNTPPGTVASIAAASSGAWKLTPSDLQKYFESFKKLLTDEQIKEAKHLSIDGIRIDAEKAASVLQKSDLPSMELALVWALCDRDTDGKLSATEYMVALHLVSCRRKGMTLPSSLPIDLEEFAKTPLEIAFAAAGLTPPLSDVSVNAFNPAFEFKNPSDGAGTKLRSATEGQSSQPIDADYDKFSFDPHGTQQPSNSNFKKGEQRRADRDRAFEQALNDIDNGVGADSFEAKSRPQPSHGNGFAKLGRNRDALEEWRDSGANLLESVIETDRQLGRRVRNEADSAHESAVQLTGVSDALKMELIRERKELERQMERKTEFERQVEDLRLSLEEVKQQKHVVELNRVSLGRDLAHYQEEILFLRSQIEEGKKDILTIQESNAVLDKNYRSTESSIQHLDVARKSVLDAVHAEKAQLKAEEAEIAQLKLSLDRLRREKDQTMSRQMVLQEKNRQAEQDRSMLFASVEAERVKLGQLRQDRLVLADEKFALSQEHAKQAQRAWMQTATSNALLSPDAYPALPPISSSKPQMEVYQAAPQHSWIRPVLPNGSSGSMVRDSKGVIASIGSYNNGSNSRGNIPNIPLGFDSKPFSTSNSVKSTTNDRGLVGGPDAFGARRGSLGNNNALNTNISNNLNRLGVDTVSDSPSSFNLHGLAPHNANTSAWTDFADAPAINTGNNNLNQFMSGSPQQHKTFTDQGFDMPSSGLGVGLDGVDSGFNNNFSTKLGGTSNAFARNSFGDDGFNIPIPSLNSNLSPTAAGFGSNFGNVDTSFGNTNAFRKNENINGAPADFSGGFGNIDLDVGQASNASSRRRKKKANNGGIDSFGNGMTGGNVDDWDIHNTNNLGTSLPTSKNNQNAGIEGISGSPSFGF